MSFSNISRYQSPAILLNSIGIASKDAALSSIHSWATSRLVHSSQIVDALDAVRDAIADATNRRRDGTVVIPDTYWNKLEIIGAYDQIGRAYHAKSAAPSAERRALRDARDATVSIANETSVIGTLEGTDFSIVDVDMLESWMDGVEDTTIDGDNLMSYISDLSSNMTEADIQAVVTSGLTSQSGVVQDFARSVAANGSSSYLESLISVVTSSCASTTEVVEEEGQIVDFSEYTSRVPANVITGAWEVAQVALTLLGTVIMVCGGPVLAAIGFALSIAGSTISSIQQLIYGKGKVSFGDGSNLLYSNALRVDWKVTAPAASTLDAIVHQANPAKCITPWGYIMFGTPIRSEEAGRHVLKVPLLIYPNAITTWATYCQAFPEIGWKMVGGQEKYCYTALFDEGTYVAKQTTVRDVINANLDSAERWANAILNEQMTDKDIQFDLAESIILQTSRILTWFAMNILQYAATGQSGPNHRFEFYNLGSTDSPATYFNYPSVTQDDYNLWDVIRGAGLCGLGQIFDREASLTSQYPRGFNVMTDDWYNFMESNIGQSGTTPRQEAYTPQWVWTVGSDTPGTFTYAPGGFCREVMSVCYDLLYSSIKDQVGVPYGLSQRVCSRIEGGIISFFRDVYHRATLGYPTLFADTDDDAEKIQDPFAIFNDGACVMSNVFVTPPQLSMRSLLWGAAVSIGVTVVAAVGAYVIKRKIRNRQRLKAIRKEKAAIDAQAAYLNDPTNKELGKAYNKAQRRFQRYADRVGYSSNSMGSFTTRHFSPAAMDDVIPEQQEQYSLQTIWALIAGPTPS